MQTGAFEGSSEDGKRVVNAALGGEGEENTHEARKKLTLMHRKFDLRRYATKRKAVVPTKLREYCCCRGKTGSRGSLSCSQFNAEVYQGMGLMSAEVPTPSNMYTQNISTFST